MEVDTGRFRLAWTLLTLAGYVVAMVLLLPVAVSIAYSAQRPFVIGLLSGAVIGATIGTGQWLLLRRRTPVSLFWVGASSIGGMVGMAIGMSVEAFATPVNTFRDATRDAAQIVIPWRAAWQTAVAGALFGVGLGAGQYWALRQFVRSAYWWIVINGGAWMVGLGVGAAIAELVTTLGALLVTGVIGAIITAYYMEEWQWEMRKRTKPIPGRHAY